jgi:transposase
MQQNYNTHQSALDITTAYLPKKDHVAWEINRLVESIKIDEPYLFGRPRQYNLSSMLKLVLFAYSRSVFTSRKIEQLAEESLPARWLTQEMVPSYRTIARFRVSEEVESLIEKGLAEFTNYLRQKNLIDDVIFIDGTKILADANKYSFVWKKATLKFDEMNRKQIRSMMEELKEAYQTKVIPEDCELSLDDVDEVLTRLEIRLEELEEQVEATKKESPNPAKQERRKLKSQKKKLSGRRDKMVDHQNRIKTCGERNSYSKTDHDATFMRIKEDPMRNGQLKPAYNLQLGTNGQFILSYELFQNPTDTRTLPPFVNKIDETIGLPKVIVADAGYGSEKNYRFLEDNHPEHTAIILYSTMLKERSRKWRTDERKVMNWQYHEEDDYYIDPLGVRFNFTGYRKTTAKKDGFVQEYKEYTAERYDDNGEEIPAALTAIGYLRRIRVNPSWEYFKAKQNEQLSDPKTGEIYERRKIEVEPVFGYMKASLGFTRYHVRGMGKVKRETGILVMAMNMMKMNAQKRLKNLELRKKLKKNQNQEQISIFFSFYFVLRGSYVTASFFS